MRYFSDGKSVTVTECADFDLQKTFDCGQCFRWERQTDGSWTGVAGGHALRLEQHGDDVVMYCDETEFSDFWSAYFDLDRDYAAVREAVAVGDYMREAVVYGRGIRILRQEHWEALCSFIISQCNNITRIKGIVSRLCENFGERISYRGETYYSFPTAERIAALSEEELACLRCGYRAKYIISAAKAVAGGAIDLDAVSALNYAEALRTLKTLEGVGDKVANCVILFGLGITCAFPIDVWMKRALKEHFPPDFDPDVFGENAGMAQQYIFHYARTGENRGDGK